MSTNTGPPELNLIREWAALLRQAAGATLAERELALGKLQGLASAPPSWARDPAQLLKLRLAVGRTELHLGHASAAKKTLDAVDADGVAQGYLAIAPGPVGQPR